MIEESLGVAMSGFLNKWGFPSDGKTVKTYTGVKKIIMTHPEEPGQPMQLGRPMPLFMV